MNNISATALRVVLALAGVFIVFSGLDTALGGLLSMGWMGTPTFFEVTDPVVFEEADSHHRFLGVLWTGLGLLYFISLTNLQKYQGMLNLSFAIIFLGGIARFSQMNLDVLLGSGVLWAVIVEVVGMPLLYVWLSKVVQQIELNGGTGKGTAEARRPATTQ